MASQKKTLKPNRPRLNNWLESHLQSLISSLGELVRTPGATIIAVSVIGITLSLPAGLYVLLENAAKVSGGWQNTARISLFLEHEVTDKEAKEVAGTLRGKAAVEQVDLITREQALEEYGELSGFGAALDALGENPLPVVLVVEPAESVEITQSEVLRDELAQLPEVHIAQLDTQWIERLLAMLNIVKRAVFVLAAVLALAVILIVGNTIRTTIQTQRDRITIARLFGATNGFIRRPFLYRGLLYGLGGGLVAWLLVETAFGLLASPVQRLAALYPSHYEFSSLSLRAFLMLLAASGSLGIIGSWFTVDRFLRGDLEV